MSEASSFSIYNPRQIIHNLSVLIKNKCLVSVRFGEGQAFFLTAILEIDEANNALIFDYGPKEELNQQLIKAARIVFEADFAGIKCSFRGSKLEPILYKGDPAFAMPIPESIFWMQRREFFRIKSPRSKGSYCQLALDEQKTVNLILYDISLTGFSLLNTSAEISDLMLPGTQFEQCKLVLSETGEDAISFKVCSKLIINPEKIDSLKIQKIGCVFTKITPVFESTVQRYINQLQRESIQKKSERA
ncbi:flagellar brake protein [Methylobacter sp. Wu8]|uniref:flagellar brake protein n=1 Tax=Methylobacter sp. Wu8 TaxID=3118457 RepID=UPI002F2F00AC